MEAVCCYPGSVGEIIQGNFKGRDILVSCPVNLYSSVKIFESKFPRSKYQNEKTARFLLNVLTSWGYDSYEKNLDIEICSQIPKGKGFASSTADLCGLYNGLLRLFKRKFDQQELIKQCTLIEPTDSIIFKKMTMFEYKSGEYYKSIGDYIEFYILVYEGEDRVDTVEFNKKPLPQLEKVDDLIQLLISGVVEKDIKKIGAVSSESIIRNQHRLKYDSLEYIFEINKKSGGDGVIGAHSGNCLGIIFHDEEKAKYASEQYAFQGRYKSYLLKSIKML